MEETNYVINRQLFANCTKLTIEIVKEEIKKREKTQEKY